MKKGFTLIELMVVVVIIGILAAIAIPNFVKTIDKAKVASVKANMHTMQVTVEGISVDRGGVYPTTSDSIATNLPKNFKNPYTNATGEGATGAYTVAADWDGSATPSGDPGVGIVAYHAKQDSTSYIILGGGKTGAVIPNFSLSAGQ